MKMFNYQFQFTINTGTVSVITQTIQHGHTAEILSMSPVSYITTIPAV